MALVATTRRFSFRSVHSLNNGVHREKIHGHQYSLEVTFYGSGALDEVTAKVNELILARLDGHDLSQLMSASTGESLVEWIHERLVTEGGLKGKILGVALQETKKNRFLSGRSNVRMM